MEPPGAATPNSSDFLHRSKTLRRASISRDPGNSSQVATEHPDGLDSLAASSGDWDALPPHVLRQAFARLAPTDRCNARLVSRWWAENLDNGLADLSPRRLSLQRTVSRFPNVASLDLRLTNGRTQPPIDSHEQLVNMRESLECLTQLTGLTELGLGGAGSLTYRGSCMGVDCAVLGALAKGLSHLSALSLADCPLVRPRSLTVLSPLSKLTSLDLKGNEQVRDTSMPVIAEALPSLRRLVLNACTKITDHGVNLLTPLDKLATLHLSHCPLVGGLFLFRLEHLTDVDLSANPEFPHCDAISMLIMPMPSLRNMLRLDLSQCTLLSDLSLMAIWPKLTSLTSLNLSGNSALTDLTLRLVARITTITELDISGLHAASDHILNCLSIDLIHLQRLTARGCKRWTNDAFMNISRIHLRQLDILDVPGITHRGLHLLGQGRIGRTLEELRMNAPDIAGECLMDALRNLRRIRTLHLNCATLSADDFEQLARCLSGALVELGLERPAELRLAGLALLVRALPRLEVLYLGDNSHLKQLTPLSTLGALTRLTLKGLPLVREPYWGDLGPLPALRDLSILCCDGLQASSFRGLSHRMPRMRVLSLAQSQVVDDEAVEGLADCETLEELDLRGSGVTERGLCALVKMGLQRLDLRSCHRISSRYHQYETRANGSAGLRKIMQWIQA